MHAANHIPKKKKKFFFYSNFMRWIISFYSRKFWIYKIDESQLCSQPSNNLFAFSSPCSDAHSKSSRPGNSISPISHPTTVFLCFWQVSFSFHQDISWTIVPIILLPFHPFLHYSVTVWIQVTYASPKQENFEITQQKNCLWFRTRSGR